MEHTESTQKHVARALLTTGVYKPPKEASKVRVVRTAQQLRDAVLARTPHIEIQVPILYLSSFTLCSSAMDLTYHQYQTQGLVC